MTDMFGLTPKPDIYAFSCFCQHILSRRGANGAFAVVCHWIQKFGIKMLSPVLVSSTASYSPWLVEILYFTAEIQNPQFDLQ